MIEILAKLDKQETMLKKMLRLLGSSDDAEDLEIMRTILDNDGEMSKEWVLNQALEKGLEQQLAYWAMEELRRKGEIYEPKAGFVRRV